MIFKTIQDSVDATKIKLLLLNKDWNTYRSNWQNANTIKGKIGSIFISSCSNTSGISKDQLQTLRVWNNAVKVGCKEQETFNRIIAKTKILYRLHFSYIQYNL